MIKAEDPISSGFWLSSAVGRFGVTPFTDSAADPDRKGSEARRLISL